MFSTSRKPATVSSNLKCADLAHKAKMPRIEGEPDMRGEPAASGAKKCLPGCGSQAVWSAATIKKGVEGEPDLRGEPAASRAEKCFTRMWLSSGLERSDKKMKACANRPSRVEG